MHHSCVLGSTAAQTFREQFLCWFGKPEGKLVRWIAASTSEPGPRLWQMLCGLIICPRGFYMELLEPGRFNCLSLYDLGQGFSLLPNIIWKSHKQDSTLTSLHVLWTWTLPIAVLSGVLQKPPGDVLTNPFKDKRVKPTNMLQVNMTKSVKWDSVCGVSCGTQRQHQPVKLTPDPLAFEYIQ